tara:strand:+ start:94 stop:543 length:450 start_codon:yes stop_codon:yes gene_type:complete
MALTGKKYEKFYATSGSGDDEVSADNLTKAEGIWDHYRAKGMDMYFDDFKLAPLIFQLQQMQDELDYLRTEIGTNKGKSTFPGFGTSNSTALVGDTKLVGIGANTTLSFGDMTETTVKGKPVYSIVLTTTRDFGGKTGSVTKSVTLTLT